MKVLYFWSLLFFLLPIAGQCDTPGCANFSGTWKGPCQKDGKPLDGEFHLSIVQVACSRLIEIVDSGVLNDARQFGFASTPFEIGSLTTQSQIGYLTAGKQAINTWEINTADWNQDQTVLSTRINTTSSRIGGGTIDGEKTFTAVDNTEYRFSGSQLATKSTGFFFMNANIMPSATFECLYSK